MFIVQWSEVFLNTTPIHSNINSHTSPSVSVSLFYIVSFVERKVVQPESNFYTNVFIYLQISG